MLSWHFNTFYLCCKSKALLEQVVTSLFVTLDLLIVVITELRLPAADVT